MDKIFEQRYLAARRKVVQNEFKHLNDKQQEAVMATEGPLLILAGAGSGKTTVLINRIANLLKFGKASDSTELPIDAAEGDITVMERGGEPAKLLAAYEPVDPWRILAITFTNKAAGELKERLSRMLGEGANDIWACTFHSACVRILRRDAEKLGFPSNFSIYDSSDSQSLIKHIVKDMNLDDKTFAVRSVLGEISRAKDEQVDAEEYLRRARALGDIRRIKLGEIYSEYMRRMFSAGAMDFDDLIYFTVKLLLENDDVCAYWQRRFQYVLVDEYQDTNRLQYLLAATIAGGWGNICVVGDDDQSIYKFRGATIENILSFEQKYKKCRVIRLEQNYRSTGRILDAANAVIRNNLGRKGKELWTNKDKGDPISLYIADNENDEAQYIASQIMAEYGRGSNWRDHAVLYRMNAQSSQLEYAFKRNGIPYRIIGGTRFFDRAEIKDVLAYLCVLSTPSDDLRLERIINNPPRGIGARSVELAAELAAQKGCSLFEIVDHANEYPALSRAAVRMRQFADMLHSLHELAKDNPADVVFDALLDRTGYLRMYEEKNTVEDTARAENIRELKTGILSYMKESGDGTLEGYLADVALFTDMDNYDKDADSVVMMTVHSAKGLEFPTVFIAGMEEGIFPGLRAIGEPEEMEEERRLCYVAITRAMNKLHIVCAHQRMLFGHTSSNRVSRFVEEIPEDYIDKRGGATYTMQQRLANRESSGYAKSYTVPPKKSFTTPRSTITAPPAPVKTESFTVGERIVHKAFGAGKITKMSPMGGDHLIEISFDNGSTKKLMLKAAAPHMTRE